MNTKMTSVIRKIKGAKACAALVASCLALLLNAAEPTITADATSVTVNVPAGCQAGAQLILAVAAADRGTEFAAWQTTFELVASVPAEGGSYAKTFDDLGFPDGNCTVRAFFKDSFEKLDYLIVDAQNEYTDTGILDTQIYGLELGYKPTGGGDFGKVISAITTEGRDVTHFRIEGKAGGGFNFCGENPDNGYTYKSYTLSTSEKNEIVARNNEIKVNGTRLDATYRTGPIGRRGSQMRLNTLSPTDGNDPSHGWWYYLKFYGQDGRLLADYVPARRTRDDVVGFFDQAEKKFVTPSGEGTFTGGSVVADSAFSDICAVTPALDVSSRTIALTVAGGIATVTVPAGVATGEKLYLVSDEADRGPDVGAWHDVRVLSESVPAEGGTFTCQLVEFCSFGANVLRAFTAEDYTRLESLTANDANDYLDLDVTDELCYGFEYGYQPLNGSGGYGKTFCALGGTFRLERYGNGSYPKYVYCFYNDTYSAQKDVNFDLDGNSCNNIVFRNKTLWHNDVRKLDGCASAPIGNSKTKLRMNNRGLADADKDYGKWYYLRLYARSDCKLVDFVPAKSANGTVGFVDLASRTFVTPTGGGGAYTSDNVAKGTVSRVIRLTDSVNYERLTIPVTAEWNGGTDTDLSKPSNWRCWNSKQELLPSDTLPTRENTAVTVRGAFAFSVLTAEDVCWRSLKFENASLAGDVDWRGSFGGDLADGFTLNLNGHVLTVDDLKGNGTITDTSASGGVLCLDVPENAKASNSDIVLTGSLKFVKTGAGEYRVAKSDTDYKTSNYAGGTVIENGYAFIPAKAHPSGANATLTVCTNGVFDILSDGGYGTEAWNDCTIILAGGTLQNGGVTVSTGHQNLKTVRVTADGSKIYSDQAFGFIGQDYAATELDLNGHTLELDALRGFYFYNTTIKNGCLNITRGGWITFAGGNGVDATTVDIEFGAGPRWDLQSNLKVRNLVMRATDAGNTIQGGGVVKIFGRFTPYTDYIHHYELQDGATLDLSQHPAVYPMVNPKNTGYRVTCAADAKKVTLDLGNRRVAANQQLLSWPEGMRPTNPVFKPVAGAQYGFDVRSDGLYVIKGWAILIR